MDSAVVGQAAIGPLEAHATRISSRRAATTCSGRTVEAWGKLVAAGVERSIHWNWNDITRTWARNLRERISLPVPLLRRVKILAGSSTCEWLVCLPQKWRIIGFVRKKNLRWAAPSSTKKPTAPPESPNPPSSLKLTAGGPKATPSPTAPCTSCASSGWTVGGNLIGNPVKTHTQPESVSRFSSWGTWRPADAEIFMNLQDVAVSFLSQHPRIFVIWRVPSMGRSFSCWTSADRSPQGPCHRIWDIERLRS